MPAKSPYRSISSLPSAFGVSSIRSMSERSRSAAFRPAFFSVQDISETSHLRPVVHRHIGIQKHRPFGHSLERIQLFPAHGDPGEIVADLGGQYTGP